MLVPALFFLLLGCFCSWLVVHLVLMAGLGRSRGGEIQHHHTHTGIIPRFGGLGIISGFSATYLLCFFLFDEMDNRSLVHYAVFAGGVGAFLLGFIDDIHPLGARIKLLAQIIIALLAHHAGLRIEAISVPFLDQVFELGYLSIAITVGWIVALMNLINLIDGLDGLAGGIGLMLMGLLAYLAYAGGIPFSLILSLGMVGAILGFLFHNFPPAKVYMGDSGAYLIGYVIAAISLLNSEKGTVLAAVIAPLLALALPISDVAFAIIRRGVRGLPLFRPDRGHIHHRLIASGLTRHQTVCVLYLFSLLALVAGLLAFAAQGRFLPIFLGVAFVCLLIVLRRQNFTVEQVRQRFADGLESRQDTKNAIYLKDWIVTEVDRADSGAHLWTDFHFVLRKVGFCRAELKIGNDTRSFYLPHSNYDKVEMLHRADYTGNGFNLTVYAEKDFFSDRQFDLVGDIACEAWSQVVSRWQIINGENFSFDAVARPPDSYRLQKARRLYRPTY
jgi:UDP-GlcNAc:undecaprenyl-phosphate GlcNAc-1-phosphate transferase